MLNDKIKHLAEQAGGTQKYVPHPGVWQFFDDELEQFVREIIKECVTTIPESEAANDDNSSVYDLNTYKKLLKQFNL